MVLLFLPLLQALLFSFGGGSIHFADTSFSIALTTKNRLPVLGLSGKGGESPKDSVSVSDSEEFLTRASHLFNPTTHG